MLWKTSGKTLMNQMSHPTVYCLGTSAEYAGISDSVLFSSSGKIDELTLVDKIAPYCIIRTGNAI